MSILASGSPSVAHSCVDSLDSRSPSWDAPSYSPSPHAEAEEAGYARGYALDWAAQPPSELDSLLKLAWTLGKVQGVSDRRQDDLDRATFECDLAEAAYRVAQDQCDHHEDEVIRSMGSVAARTIGGAR